MASKTALPIARLRALGCRVHTVIGHDPRIGEWIYGVRLPDSVDLPTVTTAEGLQSTHGVATVKVSHVDNDKRLIVEAHLYRARKPLASKLQRDEAERDIAALLSRLADVLTGR